MLGTLIGSASALKKHFPLKPPLVNKENTSINLKPILYQTFTLGYSRLLSSTLWIATLLESDIEHYKGKKNSWMYYRFLAISKLEPRFYQNYLFGGQYLSIIKDDIFGADHIYSLGLKLYPADFKLNYHAGFNAAFEIGDYSLALKYYNSIYDLPEVQTKYPSLLSIINKLRLSSGQLNLKEVFDLMLLSRQNSTNEAVNKSLDHYLYSIKAELDLICLNSRATDNCSKHDYFGETYKRTPDGNWRAQKEWVPYRLKK
ncbi:MAG: hypothetical protein CME71_05670 [Halobacteriovorax sp.]|nr:hypothetical protein [Halobacteriovorax sp.]